MAKMTANEQREQQSARLDRIEQKIDKMSDVIVALARAEEKITTLTSFSKQQSEMIQHMTIRLDRLEAAVQQNASTINIINKLFWIIIAAAATAVTGMIFIGSPIL